MLLAPIDRATRAVTGLSLFLIVAGVAGFAPARSPVPAVVPVSALPGATVLPIEAGSLSAPSSEDRRSEGEVLDQRLGEVDSRFYPRASELEADRASVERQLGQVEDARARAQQAGQVPSDLQLEIELMRIRLSDEIEDLQAEQARLNEIWEFQRNAIKNPTAPASSAD
jgi:hypothetical protein